MRPLDLAVIALYAVAMLAVGRYFKTRVQTSDDYLLGGRTMSPVMIGLSLFATLTSTLSYLAYPGELIKNGPMMFAQLAATHTRNLAILSQLINTFQNYYHYTVVTFKNREYLRFHLFASFIRLFYDGGINEYEDPDQPFVDATRRDSLPGVIPHLTRSARPSGKLWTKRISVAVL